MSLKSKQKGFTIVELLIVIVVIAILAAITMVAFGNIQQRARDTERASDASHIVKALTALTTDDRGWPTNAANLRSELASHPTTNISASVLDKIRDSAPASSGNTTWFQYAPCTTGSNITGAQIRYVKEEDGSVVTNNVAAGIGCPAI